MEGSRDGREHGGEGEMLFSFMEVVTVVRK